MSENDRKRPSPPRKPNQRAFGKPAPKPDGERRYGKPAPKPDGERRYGKPAPRPDGERRYGKPAPSPDGERRYGKPAPRPDGERRYGKPAPKPDGERRYGKPAPRPDGERRYGKPAPRPDGEQRYGKPAPKPDSERRYGRPAPRPAEPRPFGRPAPTPAPESTLKARDTALHVLNEVLEKDAYAALVLDQTLRDMIYLPYNLKADRDRRLATRLIYTTLERLLGIDYMLSKLLDAPDSLPAAIRNLLRMSASQVLYMDRVPDHAVVNEAVNLANAGPHPELAGLVNGVLRNLIRQKDTLLWPDRGDLVHHLSIVHSMPAWLVDKLIAAYGADMAEDILKSPRPEDHVVVRHNRLRMPEEQFVQWLDRQQWRYQKGTMPGAYKIYGVAHMAAHEGFREGLFTIQGEGSMAAAEATQVGRGMRVLDCCAAPGGKTAYMAESMHDTGRIFAWDKHDHRVKLLEALVQRMRYYNVRPALRDAMTWWEQFDSDMDVVLLDAPCSGMGLYQNKPEIRYGLTPEGLADLCNIQASLLDTVCRYVRPGGALVYATCSILPEENTQQVEAFLKKHPEFTIEKLPGTIPEALRAHETPLGLQLFPHRDGVEGFYMARMRRQ